MNDYEDLRRRIEAIEERNRRVEAGKAWELSWMRILFIACMIYVFAACFLLFAALPQPLLNALIPAIGYVFSMQSLPPLKRWWMKRKQ